MVKSLVLTLALFLGNASVAQELFSKYKSFKDASVESSKSGKMLLIQLENDKGCEMCNRVGKTSFENKDVQEKVLGQFVPLYIDINHADRSYLKTLYEIDNEYFGTIFLDASGNYLTKTNGTASHAEFMLKAIDSAIYLNSEATKLSTVQKIYEMSGDIESLKMLILKRASLNLNTDSLTGVYTNVLQKRNEVSDDDLLFIIKQAPALESLARNYLYKTGKYDRLWYQLPNSERVVLNSRVENKSERIAYKTLDDDYAKKLVDFIFSIYANNGSKSDKFARILSEEFLAKFYDAKDSDLFYDKAESYLSIVRLVTSPDSIKKLDELNLQKMLSDTNGIVGKVRDTVINGKNVKLMGKVVRLSPMAQYYQKDLSYYASRFYSKTNDEAKLKKALLWAERGAEFYKSTESLIVYAKLLNKLNYKDKAIAVLQEGLVVDKERKIPGDKSLIEQTIEKIKRNEKL